MRHTRELLTLGAVARVEQHGSNDITVGELHRALMLVPDQNQLARPAPLAFQRAHAGRAIGNNLATTSARCTAARLPARHQGELATAEQHRL